MIFHDFVTVFTRVYNIHTVSIQYNIVQKDTHSEIFFTLFLYTPMLSLSFGTKLPLFFLFFSAVHYVYTKLSSGLWEQDDDFVILSFIHEDAKVVYRAYTPGYTMCLWMCKALDDCDFLNGAWIPIVVLMFFVGFR